MLKKTILFFLAMGILCLSLCGCSESPGVTTACVGYSVGDEAGEIYRWHESEQRTVPAEFVRIFALYTALNGGAEPSEDEQAAVLFNYNAVAMKKVADTAGGRETLLAEMNVLAKENGLSATSFGSLTGSETAEGELGNVYGRDFAFDYSFSTLKDLREMALLFAEKPQIAELLSKLSYRFPGESNAKYRNAPLLRKNSEFYLENVVLYLAGSVAFADGSNEYIAITVLNGAGKKSVSVVAERSGQDATEPFAACDGANLAGKVIGEDYGFIYRPSEQTLGGGMTIGAGWFAIAIVVFVALLLVLILAVVIVGIITTAKRNAEGRKKYCGNREQNGGPEQSDDQ